MEDYTSLLFIMENIKASCQTLRGLTRDLLLYEEDEYEGDVVKGSEGTPEEATKHFWKVLDKLEEATSEYLNSDFDLNEKYYEGMEWLNDEHDDVDGVRRDDAESSCEVIPFKPR